MNTNDSEALYNFELLNGEYFESIGLGRGEEYYQRTNFQNSFQELLEEQKPLNKAELGYRVGKSYQGKGYATRAVDMVLQLAADNYKLHRIEAGTGKDNIGSQTVLIKNHFRYVGCYEKYIFSDGEWADSLLYEKILE